MIVCYILNMTTASILFNNKSKINEICTILIHFKGFRKHTL